MKNSENIYEIIGQGYNDTRQADPYIFENLFRLLAPSTNKTYLDIGCGTGNYTFQFAERGFNFWGIDPSGKMLEVARKKSAKVHWHSAFSDNIPLEDNFFDGAIATLTIHHWHNLLKSFNELFRVLKFESRFVIFTSTSEQTKGYWLNHYFPKMLENSLTQMPALEKIESAIINAGFNIFLTEKYFVRDDVKDQFLYSGKNRPELYFNPVFRNGISSFAALSAEDEVTKGLIELKKDIESNTFESIKKKYENNLGDYLFIVCKK